MGCPGERQLAWLVKLRQRRYKHPYAIRIRFGEGCFYIRVLAIERAKKSVFQPDWKKAFEPENVLEQVTAIVQGRTAAK